MKNHPCIYKQPQIPLTHEPKLSWVFPTVVVETQVGTKKKQLSHAQRKTCVTSHTLLKFPQSQMANITVLNQAFICYRVTNTSSFQGQTDLTHV